MKSDLTLELTSADMAGALAALTERGISLQNVVYVSELTVRMGIHRKDLPRLRQIAERRGENIRQIARMGMYWRYRALLRHPILIAGLLLLLALTVWLPTRILFVQVQGNRLIPTRLILETANQCGISFGADRGSVRSESIKNAILDALPQLQWAGVNTYGCVAVISVEERSEQNAPNSPLSGNMVAIRDGIITDITAVRGSALCRVGQAVRAGEILISGTVDCGGVILNTGAEGEVYGETKHEIWGRTSNKALLRSDIRSVETKFSLIIGKNRINFYQDSGILDTSCVKMYSEYYMSLPGGFVLPVILIREQYLLYDCRENLLTDSEMQAVLLESARSYLRSQMVAGRILQQHENIESNTLNANYICLEMIGQIRYEENTNDYGENYGENG